MQAVPLRRTDKNLQVSATRNRDIGHGASPMGLPNAGGGTATRPRPADPAAAGDSPHAAAGEAAAAEPGVDGAAARAAARASRSDGVAPTPTPRGPRSAAARPPAAAGPPRSCCAYDRSSGEMTAGVVVSWERPRGERLAEIQGWRCGGRSGEVG